jgi:hypothetical protein
MFLADFADWKEGSGAVPDNLADLVDHGRHRLVYRADPLAQNKFAVVGAHQRRERRCGVEPGRGTTDFPRMSAGRRDIEESVSLVNAVAAAG